MEPDSRHTINVLQAGRALAAFAVVLTHAALAASEFDHPFPGMVILRQGYLGVDFFFVLSGFIIYHSTAGRGRSAGSYVSARIRRVFLPYWPVGIGLALLYTFFPVVRGNGMDWEWLPTLTLLPVDSKPALFVAWTLQHEILFYGVFGLFYFADLLWLGLGAWAAMIIVGSYSGVPFAPINTEFLFGIGAAWLYRKDVGHPFLLIFAATITLLWIFLGAQQGQSILIGLACAAAILQLARAERKGRIRVPAFLVAAGGASYSVYLVHGPAISLVARIVSHSWPTTLFFGIVAGLAAGIAYHIGIERHLIALFPRRRECKAEGAPDALSRKASISPATPD